MIDIKEGILLQSELKNVNSTIIYQNTSDEPIIIGSETNENVYDQYPAEFEGGVVVYFPEDIGIIWSRNLGESIIGKLVIRIADYLTSKGLKIDLAGNDILVDGNKISGCTSTDKGQYLFEGLFVSFNADKKVIASIVKKEIDKIPVGLSKYEVKPEEILNIFEKFKTDYELIELFPEKEVK